MKRLTMLAILATVALTPVAITAQASPGPIVPDPETPRLLPIHDSVWLEELTWIEIRDLMAEGKRTVLIPTGGIEQNGPYLALGKHQIVLRATMDAVARKLGNALVTPIAPFVPEGDLEPRTGHMRYPGTISLRPETFRAMLTDIARSMKAHGFDHVVLLGDSGGNQRDMAIVADALSKEWAGSETDIIYVPEYYDNDRVATWIADQGIHEVSQGIHDDVHYTATMMSVDPQSVRADARIHAGLFSINGVDLGPVWKTQELGRRMVEFQAGYTAEAIRQGLSKHAHHE